ncbi:MAG: nitroreductase family protein, partial [bacterium]|nr:nitroreductase family protein [bacterium]
MIPRETIQKILEAGVQAPSGENCQPWRFVVKDNLIKIFNVPEKDLSLYNFHQRGSLVANGALIENIIIASSHFSYQASIKLFPEASSPNLVALVSLEKSEPKEEPLYPYIEKRTTNRNPYQKTDLSSSDIHYLSESVHEVGYGEVRFIQEQDAKRELAKCLIASDRILFENRKIHDFLFSHIIFDRKEAEERGSGFYIKELALPPPVEKIFKVLRNWNKVQLFNKIGFSKFAAKGNIKLYAASGAIGVILIQNEKPEDFILSGRLMQRIWLKATQLGLYIQPVTGVIFFMQRITGNEAQDFSQEHIDLITNSHKKMLEIFKVNRGTLSMVFRIGYAKEPKAKSFRLRQKSV